METISGEDLLALARAEAAERCTCPTAPAAILSILDHQPTCSYYKDRAHAWFECPRCAGERWRFEDVCEKCTEELEAG